MTRVEIWALAGPAAAGKSTLSKALGETLARAGVPARVLELDDFYRGESRAERRVQWEAFHGAALAAVAAFRAAGAPAGAPAGTPAGVVVLDGCYHKQSARDILTGRAAAVCAVVRWLLPVELLDEGAEGRARLALRCYYDAATRPRAAPKSGDPLQRPHIALWMTKEFSAARLGRGGPIAAKGRRHLWRVLEPDAPPLPRDADPFAMLAEAESRPRPHAKALAAVGAERAAAIAAALPPRRALARQLDDLAATGLFRRAGIVRAGTSAPLAT